MTTDLFWVNRKMKSEDRKTLKWLWSVSGKLKGGVALITLLQILNGGGSVMNAWLLRGIVDNAVEKNPAGFLYFSLLFIALTLALLLVRAGIRFLNEHNRSRLENRFKSRLFGILLQKDYASVNTRHSGAWLNRLTSDTVVVAEGLSSIVPEFFGLAVRLCFAMVMIIAIIPASSFVILPGGLLIASLSYAFRRRLKSMHKDIQNSDGRLRILLSERLSSLLIIKSF